MPLDPTDPTKKTVRFADQPQTQTEQNPSMEKVAKSAVKTGACATYAAIVNGFNEGIAAMVNFPKSFSNKMQKMEEVAAHLLHMYETRNSTPKTERTPEPQVYFDEITNEAGVQVYESQMDAVESDVRGNEKYTLVSKHISKGLKETINAQIADSKENLHVGVMDELYETDGTIDSPEIAKLNGQINFLVEVKKLRERLAKGPTKDMSPLSSTTVMSLPGMEPKVILGTPKGKCEFYTAKALYALENPDKFRNKREAFREYKDSLRTALESEYYKNNPDATLSHLLNKLAFCEFTKVNVQGLVESVAQKSAEKGEFKSNFPTFNPENSSIPKKEIHGFKKSLHDLRNYHKAIKDYSKTPEGLYSSLKGEIMCLGLDSTVQGNPTNVKCKMVDKHGKEITNVRTPTPTSKDGQVTPEFKAFLRELKAQGKKYTMINLQDRTNPGLAKIAMNRHGEMIRSNSLEGLQLDPEFADMFTCFTLDKNSDFYMQKLEGSQNAEVFIADFMDKLTTDPTSGFFIPPSFLAGEDRKGDLKDKSRKPEIKEKLEMVHKKLFGGRENLTQSEIQDFIEAAYIFLADYYIKETEADFYNESCKDCIDRGGGANWVMMSMMNSLEIFDSSRKHESSSDLSVRIANMPADMECDAVWARKRPIIPERLERAESVMATIFKALEENHQLADELARELNFKKLNFNADTSQATKDPRLNEEYGTSEFGIHPLMMP